MGNRLVRVASPLVEAQHGKIDAKDLFRRLKNPYWIGDEAGLTQTLGWIDAWSTRPSLMAVAAEGAEDIAAAVRFSSRNHVPLVTKGGGHSYFGNSNRANSLLVWTRRMRGIEVHDRFLPQGAPPGAEIPAVSIGAGTLWGEVYRTVARDHGRYVQGGGCMTVGTAGFIQGGGFGSFSKQFGTGAANLVEAEVVTADGRVRVVNPWQDPELFFALRGGGGGTFGIVTRLTLKTYPLPDRFGAVMFEVAAADDSIWRALVEHMLRFYRDALFNPKWGEQIGFHPGRRLSVSMLCHSLRETEIRAAWEPLFAWIRSQGDRLKLKNDPLVISLAGRQLWDPEFLTKLPGITISDDRPGASANNIFWATNLGEVGQVLNAYQSRWIAASWLQPDRLGQLVDALVTSSSAWSVTLHTNKGLAGGSAEALAATLETATNPEVAAAFALLICAADAPPAYPGIAGFEPDVANGRTEAARVRQAMSPIIMLDPKAGTYVSEADYFGSDWQRAYWGSNYPRLVAAKRRYDPNSLFTGHHTVEL
ncbi:FAD-binding oxidoreductase [Sphingomonas sp. HDW15A]|uniref:FAD-dependent oxidoreductase n=1 Tax=Sphingomonas sp. HDW15A TaxID=2714942 RepID=UPI00140C440B|nr:FAD-binding oxidoreductase [Sphingomonas sp. HDW15A]QIK95869.1 FAD-binding oxidoreductase [Sphingomonas sp. HDW15A]